MRENIPDIVVIDAVEEKLGARSRAPAPFQKAAVVLTRIMFFSGGTIGLVRMVSPSGRQTR